MARLAVKIALALDAIILMWLLSMLAWEFFLRPEDAPGVGYLGGSYWPTSVFLSCKFGGDKLQMQLGPDALTALLAISALLLPVLVMLLRKLRKQECAAC